MEQHNTPQPAMAMLASHEDGKHHAVGFWNLDVLIVPDGNHYFAQCRQIDYAAQGATVEETKSNFEKGFFATIHNHLDIFNSLKPMMRSVDAEFWNELMSETVSGHFEVAHVSMHDMTPQQKAEALIPYGYKGIDYAQPVIQ